MEEVVLGLGTNKSFGNITPLNILSQACTALQKKISAAVCSSVYRTAAMYVTDQEDFFNMVLLGSYDGTPAELLDFIHETEASFGRNREMEIRNGPRPLDIDIELFGSQKISEQNLIIPHERISERAFVLKPLVEVLRKYADDCNKTRALQWKKWLDSYESCLKQVEDQRIELAVPSKDFILTLKK